jgi:hypothetical protein
MECRRAAVGGGNRRRYPRKRTTPRESFGGDVAEQCAKFFQGKVDEDVVPAPFDVEAGCPTLGNQADEPGVVGMAGEIAGFDSFVPKARDQNQRGDKKNAGEIGEDEVAGTAHCAGKMLAQRDSAS